VDRDSTTSQAFENAHLSWRLRVSVSTWLLKRAEKTIEMVRKSHNAERQPKGWGEREVDFSQFP
jgi:hypothetical protein